MSKQDYNLNDPISAAQFLKDMLAKYKGKSSQKFALDSFTKALKTVTIVNPKFLKTDEALRAIIVEILQTQKVGLPSHLSAINTYHSNNRTLFNHLKDHEPDIYRALESNFPSPQLPSKAPVVVAPKDYDEIPTEGNYTLPPNEVSIALMRSPEFESITAIQSKLDEISEMADEAEAQWGLFILAYGVNELSKTVQGFTGGANAIYQNSVGVINRVIGNIPDSSRIYASVLALYEQSSQLRQKTEAAQADVFQDLSTLMTQDKPIEPADSNISRQIEVISDELVIFNQSLSELGRTHSEAKPLVKDFIINSDSLIKELKQLPLYRSLPLISEVQRRTNAQGDARFTAKELRSVISFLGNSLPADPGFSGHRKIKSLLNQTSELLIGVEAPALERLKELEEIDVQMIAAFEDLNRFKLEVPRSDPSSPRTSVDGLDSSVGSSPAVSQKNGSITPKSASSGGSTPAEKTRTWGQFWKDLWNSIVRVISQLFTPAAKELSADNLKTANQARISKSSICLFSPSTDSSKSSGHDLVVVPNSPKTPK